MCAALSRCFDGYEGSSLLFCLVFRVFCVLRELFFRNFGKRVYDFGIILDEAFDGIHRPQKCAKAPGLSTVL